jgi:hypothetical protein
MKKLMMFFAGALAAAAVIAVVSGCFNPVQPRARIPSSADGTFTDGTSTDGTSTNAPFTVTLQVGGEAASRAVVGPNDYGIKSGGIRNIVQIIVIKADTGEVESFQQISQINSQEKIGSFTVPDLWVGSQYHFLVLMGHRERDYDAETNPEVEYIYKDDSPTLLAGGL